MTIYTDDSRLVSLWRMEEVSGDRADTVGSNTLTDNNTVASSVDAQEGSRSADFERDTSEYLSIADGSQVGLDLDDFTICFWVKFEAINQTMTVVSKNDNASQQSYELRILSANTYQARIGATGTSTTGYTGNTSVTAGTWIHIAIVYNKTDVRLYFNGVLDNSPTSRTSTTFNSTTAFELGRRGDGSFYLDGLLDEVAIFNEGLSAADVLDIYTNTIQDAVGGADPVDLYDASNSLVSTHATIQAAINAAASGYTIRVGAGTYYEEPTLAGKTGVTIDKRVAEAVPVITSAVQTLVEDLNSGNWTLYATTGGKNIYKHTISISVNSWHALLGDDTPLWSYGAYNSTQGTNNLVDAVAGQGIYYGTAPGDGGGTGFYIWLTGNVNPNTVEVWASTEDHNILFNNTDDCTLDNLYLKVAGDANILLKNSDGNTIGSGVTCDFALNNIWAKNDGAGSTVNDFLIDGPALIQRHASNWTWDHRKNFTPKLMESSNVRLATGSDQSIVRNCTIQGGFNCLNVGKAAAGTPYLNADFHDLTITFPAVGQFDDVVEPENYMGNVRFWNLDVTNGWLAVAATPLHVQGASGEVTVCDSIFRLSGLSGQNGTDAPRLTKHDAADTIDSDSDTSLQVDHCTFIIDDGGFGIQMNVTNLNLIQKYKFTNNIVYLLADGKYTNGGPSATYDCVVNGNIFYRLGGTGYVIRNLGVNDGNTYNTLALWEASAAGLASGWTANIEADPLINPSTGVILSAFSPALNAAIPVSYDYGGSHASRPDIGFYQYSTVSGGGGGDPGGGGDDGGGGGDSGGAVGSFTAPFGSAGRVISAGGPAICIPSNPEPILRVTSGTRTLDLLRYDSGIELIEPYWQPNVAQYKGGGQFVDSAVADGKRLVFKTYDNVVERIPLSIRARSQAAAINTLRELLQLGRQAADYWTEAYELDQVWLEVKPAGSDCLTGYARIAKMQIPELPDPFHQPFFSPYSDAILDEFNLLIEREPLWRGVPPGELIGPFFNVIKNPDFELWNFGVVDSQPDSWDNLVSATSITGSNSREQGDFHSGTACLKVQVTGSTASGRAKGVSQTLSGLSAGTTYTALAWIRNDGVSNGVGRILVTYSSQLELYSESSKHGWLLYAGVFTTGASDTVAIHLEILTIDANCVGAVYFDSLMIVEGDWREEAANGLIPYMSSAHVVNHWDQVGSTLLEAGDLNYVDVWDVPGDESALVRLEMVNNTPDAATNNPVVIETIRAGLRRTGTVFNFDNYYDPPGVTDTSASGDDRVDSGTLSTTWATVGFFTIDDAEVIRDNLGRFRVLARVWDTSTSGALNLEVRLRYWIGISGVNLKTLESVTVPGRGSWYIVDLTGNAALNWDVKGRVLPGALGLEVQMKRATGSSQGRLDYVEILPTDGGVLFANITPSIPLGSGLVVDGTNSTDVYGVRRTGAWREVYTTVGDTQQLYLLDFREALYISTNGARIYKFQNNGGTFLYDYGAGSLPLVTFNNRLYALHRAAPSTAYDITDGFPGTTAFTFGNLITPSAAIAFNGKMYVAVNTAVTGSLLSWDGSAGTATTLTTGSTPFTSLGIYRNKIYIGGSDSSVFAIIDEYDIATGTRTRVLSTGEFGGGGSFAEFNGKLYFATGGDTDKIYRFDGLAWESLTPLALGMQWLALGVVGDKLYLTGGQVATDQIYVLSTTDGETWETEYTPGSTGYSRGASLAFSQGQIFMGTIISAGSATLHAIAIQENQYKVPDYQLSDFRAPNREWGSQRRHRYVFSFSRENGVDVQDDRMLVGVGIVPRFLSLIGTAQ